MSIGIYVVATKKRKALIEPFLKEMTHEMCWTKDYRLPAGWQPEPSYAPLIHNQVGHLRCWRGHQDALTFAKEMKEHDIALVLEDDAVPNTQEWFCVVQVAARLLDQFDQLDLISLHGRCFDRSQFTPYALNDTFRSLLIPKQQGSVWVQGSLAYLVRMGAVDAFLNDSYNGYPMDLYICNRFKFALLDPSPFDHNRSEGSLIDCPVPAA